MTFCLHTGFNVKVNGYEMKTLGILSIATNKYIDYWKDQAESIDLNLGPLLQVTLHVFTDRTSDAEQIGATLRNVKVMVHEIPSLGWPKATLYRYKVFSERSDLLQQDFLMYLDADMVVHQPFVEQITYPGADVTLVQHPGYFRPRFPQNLALYALNPKLILVDLNMQRSLGAIGAWETRESSTAFVKREAREKYFCGGIWWGKRLAMLSMIEDLRINVELDEANSIMALWHDESHLNRWGADNKARHLDPRFCYSLGYKWLKKLPNVVQAIDKVDVNR